MSAGQGRGPFTVPIWYQYAPGGQAWVLTEAGSRKARLIAAAGRVAPSTQAMAGRGGDLGGVPLTTLGGRPSLGGRFQLPGH